MSTQPRFLTGLSTFAFFTGKGGAGKASIACATVVWHAAQSDRDRIVGPVRGALPVDVVKGAPARPAHIA